MSKEAARRELGVSLFRKEKESREALGRKTERVTRRDQEGEHRLKKVMFM